MPDILFKTEDWVFSYRVAGICVHNGCVLLQKPTNDTGYAFPGGHVEFGETNAETLAREFKEEIGADVSVGELKWVGELFFPWGDKPCHQICLYYMVELCDNTTPRSGSFYGLEKLENREFKLGFHWVPISELKNIEVYPVNAPEMMEKLHEGVQYFIYKETV